nr:ribonuclease H-like domain-containing protein [Tanacetum cinerariifolium]
IEFSVARTPQQNGVAKKKNKTLIEAARTMLADSKLSTTFWAEVVNNACYVQNRVLVIKLHNRTPYELFLGRTPALNFMRPFGCPLIILNTLDHLGFIKKFWQTATIKTVDNGEQEITATVDGIEFNVTEASVRRHLQLADAEGEETTLFPTMLAIQSEEGEGNQTNGNVGIKANIDAGQAGKKEDRPEVTLPPRKRLGIALGPRYEVEESSSAAAARPARGLGQITALLPL